VLRIAGPGPYPILKKPIGDANSARPFFQEWNGLPRSPTVPCHNVNGVDNVQNAQQAVQHPKFCDPIFCGGRNPKTSAGLHHRIFGEQQLLTFGCLSVSTRASMSIAKKSPNTSKKRCKKEPQSFSHCGSFDHLDLQKLNDCSFFFFVLRLLF